MNVYDKSGTIRLTVKKADTFFKRLAGLMFQPALPPGHGLLLTSCSRVHTCFMRFPIDAIYLDDNHEVLDIETLAPWRIGKRVEGTSMILETATGFGLQLRIGMRLIFEDI
jgi:uncharacterized membrane protein (UPF0127 family)